MGGCEGGGLPQSPILGGSPNRGAAPSSLPRVRAGRAVYAQCWGIPAGLASGMGGGATSVSLALAGRSPRIRVGF